MYYVQWSYAKGNRRNEQLPVITDLDGASVTNSTWIHAYRCIGFSRIEDGNLKFGIGSFLQLQASITVRWLSVPLLVPGPAAAALQISCKYVCKYSVCM